MALASPSDLTGSPPGPTIDRSTPEWRNWQTRRIQNPFRVIPSVGSSPTSGIRGPRLIGVGSAIPPCRHGCDRMSTLLSKQAAPSLQSGLYSKPIRCLTRSVDQYHLADPTRFHIERHNGLTAHAGSDAPNDLDATTIIICDLRLHEARCLIEPE